MTPPNAPDKLAIVLDGAGLAAAHRAVAAHYPGCDIGSCRMGCACYQHARDAVEAYLKTTSVSDTDGRYD